MPGFFFPVFQITHVFQSLEKQIVTWNRLFFPLREPDHLFRLGFFLDQLPENAENFFQLTVIFPLQGLDLFPQCLVAYEHFPQSDEGAHDLDIDRYGAFAPEHA